MILLSRPWSSRAAGDASGDCHRCFAQGKHVLCEKPLGLGSEQSRTMAAAARRAASSTWWASTTSARLLLNWPAEIITRGEIGDITFLRAEHTEDFLVDPQLPGDWRTQGRANGNLGDLSPTILNAALALAGADHLARRRIARSTRRGGGVAVGNDDQSAVMCRFASGAMGQLFISRHRTGRKMDYAYEIYGTKGSIRFDQEDQNALWLYHAPRARRASGFAKILTGPLHPDYKPFCLGPRSRHWLPGPDHHRGARFPAGDP